MTILGNYKANTERATTTAEILNWFDPKTTQSCTTILHNYS